MKANIKTARSIICSYLVNVNKYPEFLVDNELNSKSCERNRLVANCMIAIDELKESL
jgi:hypothetical protein